MIRKPNSTRKPKGAAAITVAITLSMLIGAASLVIDMGQLYTVRQELQEVAGAAALAGAAQLIREQGGQAVRDCRQAILAAQAVTSAQSRVRGLPSEGDEPPHDLTIHFGFWDVNAADAGRAWTDLGVNCPCDPRANALRTNLRRTSETIFGPVTKLFAKVCGFPSSTASATATAYLDFIPTPQNDRVTAPLQAPAGQGAVATPRQVSGRPDNQATITFGARPGARTMAMMPRLVE